MRKHKKKMMTGVLMATLLVSTSAWPESILSTKHNLSISGPGDVTASNESQVCIFCHIPHRDGAKTTYLWNRSDPSNPYTPYDSSTLNAIVGQPTGASRMCLSCHDGTIALGATASTPSEIPFKGDEQYMREGSPSNLGTDLSDDHPISFLYDTALSAENLELKDPAMLPPAVTLEHGDQLQCTSCHDPHDDAYGRFLVMDNAASSLCTACHDKQGWYGSTHSRSTAPLVRSNGLWANTDYRTVGENGCENCHLPHSAGAGNRLLYFSAEEDNCLACHDGRVASTDIADMVSRRYRHPVQQYTGVHDAAEDFTFGNVPEHVECSDCHNPHRTSESPSVDGVSVSGANRGVTGVSSGGAVVAEARYLYEICFKCHGDNNVIDTMPIPRQIGQLNTRMEFDTSNPSFHPVAGKGKNMSVPSLLPPYTVNSSISCTDCHGSSDPAAAAGPHGSDYPYLLRDRYVTVDSTPESASNYGLCYRCHSQSILFSDESFPHSLHVVEEETPCSACHDPHGVSAMQGSSLHNSHLINFDLSIVSTNGAGRLDYVDGGSFAGQCFLTCHGKLHNPIGYPRWGYGN